MTGCKAEPYILPIRGEYLLLDKKKAHLVKGNIYPVITNRFLYPLHLIKFITSHIV